MSFYFVFGFLFGILLVLILTKLMMPKSKRWKPETARIEVKHFPFNEVKKIGGYKNYAGVTGVKYNRRTLPHFHRVRNKKR